MKELGKLGNRQIRWINPVARGWMNYYGRFYRTEILALLRRINTYLVRWARRRFKRE